jgi:hypothetical protein
MSQANMRQAVAQGKKKGRPRHGSGLQFSLAIGIREQEGWGLLPDYAVDFCFVCEVLGAEER